MSRNNASATTVAQARCELQRDLDEQTRRAKHGPSLAAARIELRPSRSGLRPRRQNGTEVDRRKHRDGRRRADDLPATRCARVESQQPDVDAAAALVLVRVDVPALVITRLIMVMPVVVGDCMLVVLVAQADGQAVGANAGHGVQHHEDDHQDVRKPGQHGKYIGSITGQVKTANLDR